MDPLSFSTILATLKMVGEIAKETKNAQLNQVTIDLQGEILDLQSKVMVLQSEKFSADEASRDLLKQNQQMKESAVLLGKLEFRNEAYWNTDDKSGPFCSACFDNDRKLIRLHADGNPAYASCPVCKSHSVKVKPDLDAGFLVHPSSDEGYL